MFYIILYISLCLLISYLIYKKTSGLIENFINYRIVLTNESLHPVQFILDTETTFIDDNFAKCIRSFYPIRIKKAKNIIEYINSNNNTMGICYKSQVNRLYMDDEINNVELLHDIYYEYICVIANKDFGIMKFSEIYNEKPIIYVINSQKNLLIPLIKILFPDFTIERIPSLIDLKVNNNKKYIIFFVCPELSNILDEYSMKNKFMILDLPRENDAYKYINFQYPDIKLDKMNISKIKTINVNNVVNTFQLSKCIIINKNTNINNFVESIFERFEYIRLFNSSNHYRIPMQSFIPEMILKLNIIPLHNNLKNYFRELGIITENHNPICKNTIYTLKCDASKLEENSFRLLGFN